MALSRRDAYQAILEILALVPAADRLGLLDDCRALVRARLRPEASRVLERRRREVVRGMRTEMA